MWTQHIELFLIALWPVAPLHAQVSDTQSVERRVAQLEGQVAAKVVRGALGGVSRTFSVRVESAVPGSEADAEWRNSPPVPEFRR